MSTYALINLSSGLVTNVIALDEPLGWPVPDGFAIVQTDVAGIGWSYVGGVFSPPPSDPQNHEDLARLARLERDQMLRSVYDPGILMAQRALRMAGSPEATTYAEGKIAELDDYAELLVAVPDQAGFPQTIIWPVAPTK